MHELTRFGVASWADPDLVPPPARLVRGALLALMDPGALDAEGWAVDISLGEGREVGLTVAPATPERRGLRRLRLAETGTAAAAGTVDTTLGTLRRLRLGECTEADAVATGQLLVDLPATTRARVASLLGWS
ncbi:hypothetical protein [Rhabdothermincola salaria]|uniref:hypothetical protein n=1 Tax=Rhabdothermincola salaria TaxID=2903142 RepID=UPI001E59CF81|nr:hypothetical protein [Rhabdothermincola salaria]MCD9623008.1 hypothetical protein [Rhabdothermincola salaria]